MPDKVVMEKADDFKGFFEFKPLEKGFGVTIGNALRRILLSSLEGYAITTVKIGGVLHEFSTIEGVKEDVSEIILNLKKVRFKKVPDVMLDNRVSLTAKNKDVFTAGMLQDSTGCFQILNPDFVICHFAPNTKFEIDLTVERGRGYVPSEEHKLVDQALGVIPIDSIFTPIKNVKYTIENTRVEQKIDYEKLLLEIDTDGSIHPEDALKGAAYILIQHFMLFSDKTMTFESVKAEEVETVDEEFLHMRKLLKTSLADLDLSVRAYNCLKAADIKSLGDLASLDVSDMMKFRNFGKKSLAELEQLMSDKNLRFGMDTVKYKLDED